MTLIDFGHLSARIMHTAVGQMNPKINKDTKKFDTSDWAPMYIHLLLKNLSYLKLKFEREYGELIICVDNKHNWRKEVYTDYKANRSKKREESNIDFESFYKIQDELLENLDLYFPFKVVKVDRAEADDVIGVLAKEYSEHRRTVVVSSDKDFKQVLEYGSRLFDPISKIFINMSTDELKEWKVIHILGGDDSDNIPHIKEYTEFTPEFRAFLSTEGIYKDISVDEFLGLSISTQLFNKYQVYEVITAGKLKGQFRDVKKIYKKIGFGEVGMYTFAKDLKENLRANPMYLRNFKRNQQLVLFENIPTEVRNDILDTYRKSSIKFDTTGIMNLFTKYHLIELMKTASDFFQLPAEVKHLEKNVLEEWV